MIRALEDTTFIRHPKWRLSSQIAVVRRWRSCMAGAWCDWAILGVGHFIICISSLARRCWQGGGGTWKRDQHSHFFFRGSGWPSTPHLPNIVCFLSSDVFFECFSVIWVYFFLIHVPITSTYLTINLQDPNLAWKYSVHDSLGRGTYVGNYWKQQVLWTALSPPISLPGLVQMGSGQILELSYGQSKHSLMWQMLTEGYAQPLEHQNVPPLHTFTHSPNRFRSLIFGFRESKSLRIRPLVFQLHAATPLKFGVNKLYLNWALQGLYAFCRSKWPTGIVGLFCCTNMTTVLIRPTLRTMWHVTAWRVRQLFEIGWDKWHFANLFSLALYLQHSKQP